MPICWCVRCGNRFEITPANDVAIRSCPFCKDEKDRIRTLACSHLVACIEPPDKCPACNGITKKFTYEYVCGSVAAPLVIAQDGDWLTNEEMTYAFCNETKFVEIVVNGLAKLKPPKGTVVGVSGTVLDLALCVEDCSSIICVDINKYTLLAVQFVVRVATNLCGLEKDSMFAQVQQLSINFEKKWKGANSAAERFQALIEETKQNKRNAEEVCNLWVALHGGVTPDETKTAIKAALQKSIHSNWFLVGFDKIVALAKAGKIKYVLGSLAKESTFKCINTCISEVGASVSVFNLSNVLDYVWGAGNNVNLVKYILSLPHGPGSRLITSSECGAKLAEEHLGTFTEQKLLLWDEFAKILEQTQLLGLLTEYANKLNVAKK